MLVTDTLTIQAYKFEYNTKCSTTNPEGSYCSQ